MHTFVEVGSPIECNGTHFHVNVHTTALSTCFERCKYNTAICSSKGNEISQKLKGIPPAMPGRMRNHLLLIGNHTAIILYAAVKDADQPHKPQPAVKSQWFRRQPSRSAHCNRLATKHHSIESCCDNYAFDPGAQNILALAFLSSPNVPGACIFLLLNLTFLFDLSDFLEMFFTFLWRWYKTWGKRECGAWRHDVHFVQQKYASKKNTQSQKSRSHDSDQTP